MPPNEPLAATVNAFADAGFAVDRVIETRPDAQAVYRWPDELGSLRTHEPRPTPVLHGSGRVHLLTSRKPIADRASAVVRDRNHSLRGGQRSRSRSGRLGIPYISTAVAEPARSQPDVLVGMIG